MSSPELRPPCLCQPVDGATPAKDSWHLAPGPRETLEARIPSRSRPIPEIAGSQRFGDLARHSRWRVFGHPDVSGLEMRATRCLARVLRRLPDKTLSPPLSEHHASNSVTSTLRSFARRQGDGSTLA